MLILLRSRSLSRGRALQDGRPPIGDLRRRRGRREHRRLLNPARRLIVCRLMLLLLQAVHDMIANVVVVVALEARDRGYLDLLVDLSEEMKRLKSDLL